MILIPGLACGGEVWTETVQHFSDRYEMHVVTLAGFAGEPALAEPFLGTVRSELIRYIDSHKLERPIIVGHSLGGFMAFWLGATAGDSVGPIVAVDGVPFLPSLMNPEVTADSVREIAKKMQDDFSAMSQDQFAVQNQQILRTMISDPADVEWVAKTASKSDPPSVGLAVYELMTTDLREKMAEITSPAMLITAGAFATTPDLEATIRTRYQEQIRDIPVHKLIVAKHARHFVMLDDPEFLFGQMEQFLGEIAGN